MESTDPFRMRDPGVQAERTALAWSRAALALLANSLLVLRSGWVNERTTVSALGFVLLFAAAALYVQGVWRRSELLATHRAVAPRAGVIRAAAVIALATSVIGLASVVSHQAPCEQQSFAPARPSSVEPEQAN